MTGHVFITHGDLLHLQCDAILIPSGLDRDGHPGHLTKPWTEIEGLPRDVSGLLTIAPSEDERVVEIVTATGATPAIWAAHSGADEKEAEWYAAAFRAFIGHYAAGRHELLERRPLADPRPLLGVPFLGAGHGGMGHAKGALVDPVIAAILENVSSDGANVDVVLVLNDDIAYSAAQGQRRRWLDTQDANLAGHSGLTDAEAGTVERLAAEAGRGRLVLFFGAGVSMGAGLPSWSELLTGLGRSAGLDPERRAGSSGGVDPPVTEEDDHVPDGDEGHGTVPGSELAQLLAMDPRDAGAVLERRFSDGGPGGAGKAKIRSHIERVVTRDRVSLMHQLLASLPVSEALTTNYDTLFEKVWHDTGRSPTVLPKASQSAGSDWLVKLHGSIDDRDRPLVLSRDDYLRFETSDTALAGIVHAMFLTRHLMFVGYSLNDDNFHRIVHQVRETISTTGDQRQSSGRFGTVVTDQVATLASELWSDELEFVSTNDRSDGGVRRVAILLDVLAAAAAAPARHLLDDSFEAAFSDEELALAETLQEVRSLADADGVRDGIRAAVHRALTEFESRRPAVAPTDSGSATDHSR